MEKTYFFTNSKFTSQMDEIGFEPPKLVTDGGSANYKIEVTDASVKSFKALATAVVDFDGDGVFDQWQIDQDKNLKQVTKD